MVDRVTHLETVIRSTEDELLRKNGYEEKTLERLTRLRRELAALKFKISKT